MSRCLELAERGRGCTKTNPLVGCVVVQNNRILAEGWHRAYGERHAEADALWYWGDAELPSDATVYVSLEPCAHHGKTPPCADLLIRRGAKKVVCALGDPYPKVNGSGFARLRETGIEVINGILEKEATWQNRIFLHNIRQQRPFVILKWAETLNGMIAPQPAARKQISGKAAHLLLHRWRAEEAAICIGRHTFETDQPQLTNRYWGNRQPLRIVLDPHLKVNPASLKRMGSESPIWLVNTVHKGSDGNIRWIQCSEANFLYDLMYELHLAGIASVLVEGGPFTLQTFIRAGLADEYRIIRSRHISWNEGIPAPRVTGTLRDHLICQEDEILILQP